MAQKNAVKKAAPVAKPAVAKKVAKTAVSKKPASATKAPAKKAGTTPASELISRRIHDLGDWRGETLARVRSLIHEADPTVLEEWKWMGTPVWSHDGVVCTGESYKLYIKLTFAKGAFLPDPRRLFNSSLTGNMRRAIDIRVDDKIDAPAFKALFREAVVYNQAHLPKRRR